MNQRQHTLLVSIIEQYCKTAVPVGSKLLAQSPDFGVSAATIRNEMAELELMGYITHPHTSAGRIPTEKGYLYYLENIVRRNAERSAVERLKKAYAQDSERAIQGLAKELADLSGLAVVVGFEDRRYFYSGISHLFSQPEFSNTAYVTTLSGVIDAFDDVLDKIFDSVTRQTQVFVGEQNPFGNDCSCLLAKFTQGKDESGVLGIVGPLRMDYARNHSLLESALEIIQKAS